MEDADFLVWATWFAEQKKTELDSLKRQRWLIDRDLTRLKQSITTMNAILVLEGMEPVMIPNEEARHD